MPEDKDKSKNENKALDLLGDSKKKPSRRERQRDQASVEKTLDDKKKEALDIFSDEGKKKMAEFIKESLTNSVNFQDTVFNNDILIGRYHTSLWIKIIICLNVISYGVYFMMPLEKFSFLINNHFASVLYNEL